MEAYKQTIEDMKESYAITRFPERNYSYWEGYVDCLKKNTIISQTQASDLKMRNSQYLDRAEGRTK